MQLFGYNYSDTIILIQLFGYNYSDTIIRIQLFGYNYSDTTIRIQLFGYNYSDRTVLVPGKWKGPLASRRGAGGRPNRPPSRRSPRTRSRTEGSRSTTRSRHHRTLGRMVIIRGITQIRRQDTAGIPPQLLTGQKEDHYRNYANTQREEQEHTAHWANKRSLEELCNVEDINRSMHITANTTHWAEKDY